MRSPLPPLPPPANPSPWPGPYPPRPPYVAQKLRWLWAELVYAATTVGYWIRPYDMLADERRWAWRPRTCCTCGRPAYRRTHRRRTAGYEWDHA